MVPKSASQTQEDPTQTNATSALVDRAQWQLDWAAQSNGRPSARNEWQLGQLVPVAAVVFRKCNSPERSADRCSNAASNERPPVQCSGAAAFDGPSKYLRPPVSTASSDGPADGRATGESFAAALLATAAATAAAASAAAPSSTGAAATAVSVAFAPGATSGAPVARRKSAPPASVRR